MNLKGVPAVSVDRKSGYILEVNQQLRDALEPMLEQEEKEILKEMSSKLLSTFDSSATSVNFNTMTIG